MNNQPTIMFNSTKKENNTKHQDEGKDQTIPSTVDENTSTPPIPTTTKDETYQPKRGLIFEYATDSSTNSASGQGAAEGEEGEQYDLIQPSPSLSYSLRKKQPRRRTNGLFSDKRNLFNFVVFVIPCFISMWYSAAILFPPEARAKYDLLLWDDGQLVINRATTADGTTAGAIVQLSLCPRASICSEGLLQLISIALARLSAFASYVFMGATFLTKMHFLHRFLASTYIRKYIPFETIHHIHKKSSKIFGGLILLHTISHYVRYIARGDVDQLSTKVHVSGLIGFCSILVLIIGMSGIVKRRAFCKFETRFNLHWIGMFVLVGALCIHHWRVRLVTLIFMALWSLDYLFGMIFATYNLEVVEFTPLPNKGGVQMLWHNPSGFNPKSGEFVKIQIPWLSEGGDEWHPFSIYLKESTERGFKSVHNIQQRRNSLYSLGLDEEAVTLLSLKEFMRLTLMEEFETKDSPRISFVEEAREDIHNKYDTTQVFICPVGDWSKNLMKELEHQQQKRACWVRGPYTSPYCVAQNFSHLVLTATGIGITPALGVMGQYPGFSRTKVLVWSTRDKNMLKFFAPLIDDAHLAVIYYTGKEKLTTKEVLKITKNGNIYLQQDRPSDGFSGTVESVVVEFENHINLSGAETIEELNMVRKAAWCVLYCGGSNRIKDELKQFSKENGVGFESELFNW